MKTPKLQLSCVACVGLLACGGAAPPASAPSAASVCGESKAVNLDDGAHTGDAFRALAGPLTGTLQFRCPSERDCALPEDRTIEVRVTPLRTVACEFAACRVPYLGSLPFELSPSEPCPRVLWSVARVALKTERGTLDEQVAEVNVLATPRGEGFLRFMIESPRSLSANPPPGEARTLLLDVQLEAVPGRVRGQMSALAAPLPDEPAPELRFAAIWTATWESVAKP